MDSLTFRDLVELSTFVTLSSLAEESTRSTATLAQNTDAGSVKINHKTIYHNIQTHNEKNFL